jgi:hypothetical protein
MSSISTAAAMEGLSASEVTLFQSVFAYLHTRVGPKVVFEEVVRLTRSELDSIKGAMPPPDWDTAEPSRVEDAKVQSKLWRPLRIAVSVADVHEPSMVLVPNADGSRSHVEASAVRVVDRSGDSIWSLDLLGPASAAKLQQMKRTGGTIEILCVPVALPGKIDAKKKITNVAAERRTFFVHILDLRTSTSALDLLGATAAERGEAREQLARLQRDQVIPGAFILDQLVEGLNVVGLSEFPLLEDILQLQVLQALSTGHVDHAPGRLHCMVVGPPGQGKKLVGLAAKALNPVTSEMSPTKASPAGLIGASHHSVDGWKSTPGCIPRAAGGVALLQDAHGWDETTVRKLAPILQEVLEDGVVRDSVAGGTKRLADTSIVMDLNRAAQVGLAGGEAPIQRVRPVLSRFDVIFEIPEDAPRAWGVAGQLCSSVQVRAAGIEEAAWIRRMRLLVATLRDRHIVIDLDPVRDLMAEVHEEIWSKNEPLFASRPDAGDVPVRLVISMTRLIAASARARDSSVASPEDVQLAEKFVNYKLEYLQLHSTRPEVEPPDASTENANRKWVEAHAIGTVKSQDLISQYETEMGATISEKTIRRHLKALGRRKVGKGVYAMPSVDAVTSISTTDPSADGPVTASDDDEGTGS